MEWFTFALARSRCGRLGHGRCDCGRSACCGCCGRRNKSAPGEFVLRAPLAHNLRASKPTRQASSERQSLRPATRLRWPLRLRLRLHRRMSALGAVSAGNVSGALDASTIESIVVRWKRPPTGHPIESDWLAAHTETETEAEAEIGFGGDFCCARRAHCWRRHGMEINGQFSIHGCGARICILRPERPRRGLSAARPAARRPAGQSINKSGPAVLTAGALRARTANVTQVGR